MINSAGACVKRDTITAGITRSGITLTKDKNALRQSTYFIGEE